ncbi:Major facilitator superfamily domain general substrate transporter [Penicillium robsamsonii]|uniref:Major facilitator superfamily domain general substrate transporter n=1 Tax=Penicillium robsamsonii TaxID=1792511 RepID=UPI0025468FCE|nr:Major facilitator superfamily domain general substrate transporter [Penicillium robsamsonii]KAJ5812968.1 Major facilitator superfamily domain general substrate transporter [Penicillium robsamsonii]
MSPQAFDSSTTTPRLSIEHGSIDAGVADTIHDKSETDVENAVEAPQKPDNSNKDPNLVDWDGKDDPENPQNYSNLRKWIITLTMSSMTVWITFASSVFSTATLVTAKEFNVSAEVMVLGTSLVVFGFALGPLCWAPLSELYGRRIPLFSGYAIFAIFQIPVAVAQNLETILVCRFLIGVFGCSPLAVVAGAMADIWNPVDRAVAIALFSGATFLGPIMGPIVGGFITDSNLGWRWTAWITLIASSFFGIIALFVVPETYGPVILQKRAARLRVETKNWALHSFLDEHKPTMSDIVTKYLFRPPQMLAQEPILLAITLYLTLIYGILYLFFEAYPISFGEVRGWTHEGVAALPFIGILIGVVLGICLIIFNTKTRFARKLAKHGKVVPEERLVPMMIASVLLPIGLFWFGWTSSPNISWVPQVIAGVPIGLGILVIFMQGLNYIIDVYMMFANSAIAANTLIRSIVGGSFPLFATQMYRNLGVAWASSVLGFITLAMIPIPLLFFIYGARIRAMSKFSPKF